MKVLLGVTAALAFFATPVMAQSNVFSVNVVGYVNRGFYAGDNLFCNPLAFTNNSLSCVIPAAPPGTVVSLWNAAARAFTQSSVFNSGIWSCDFLLPPGQGARLSTAVSFTNTFVGGVLMPDGSPYFTDPPLPLPPAFGDPDGVYLLSCKTPMQLSGESIFNYVFGRAPRDGEQVMTFDPVNQLYRPTTFSAGDWDNGEPVLRAGDAAFFNIGPTEVDLAPSIVPEPSSLTLAVLLCLGVLGRRRSPG